MPTRPKKGSTRHQNSAGRTKSGGQKAVVNHEDQVAPDEE